MIDLLERFLLFFLGTCTGTALGFLIAFYIWDKARDNALGKNKIESHAPIHCAFYLRKDGTVCWKHREMEDCALEKKHHD